MRQYSCTEGHLEITLNYSTFSTLHYPIYFERACLQKLQSKLSKPQWRREQLISYFFFNAPAT